ncbi:NAD(P)-dependent oxidoreductase [Streptomyces alanosinicus]|uniref:3-hydroxyisobutyrate dehydrogenase n=1 Tax=Streptomyces alanosinicus TaxID=68171 RepID=A0A918YU45_9ACTN|nr:NAD(P)-binding domain-containing protein [Streptomyces alanosinicus]GHE15230.1 3-hydroxyisobutyrate dehydrogenase [Streptomyces alanosinicus]
MGTTVSVLGLGQMGATLARTLRTAGHSTTVWNRTPGRADQLVEQGAVAVESAAAAVTASPLVLVCLATYDAVREALGPLTAELSGRTVVNLTSGSPPHARETATWAVQHGAVYLDGVIMTTPDGIGTSHALLLCSGPPTVFEAARTVLATLGDPVYLGTDPALASVYDTALLGLMWGTLTGWLHAVALIGADGPGGRGSATHFTAVADRWLTTVRSFMNTYAAQVDAGQYPAEGFDLRLHQHTMEILAHASELRGISPLLPDLLRELTGRAVAAGHGDDSYARLVEFLRLPKDGGPR